jgi:hypothetical protein
MHRDGTLGPNRSGLEHDNEDVLLRLLKHCRHVTPHVVQTLTPFQHADAATHNLAVLPAHMCAAAATPRHRHGLTCNARVLCVRPTWNSMQAATHQHTRHMAACVAPVSAHPRQPPCAQALQHTMLPPARTTGAGCRRLLLLLLLLLTHARVAHLTRHGAHPAHMSTTHTRSHSRFAATSPAPKKQAVCTPCGCMRPAHPARRCCPQEHVQGNAMHASVMQLATELPLPQPVAWHACDECRGPYTHTNTHARARVRKWAPTTHSHHS